MPVGKLALKRRDIQNKRKRFLAEYAKCGNIALAAKKARVERTRHYDWLEDPDYERQFAAAHQEACETLESEAYRRAVVGVMEPQWYQGERCGLVRKFSDTLLIFLMKGMMPDKYRETFKGEIQHKATISRGPDLSQLTYEQFEQLKQLAGYNGNGSTTLKALAGSPADSSGGGEESEE
jgi:hypothetical protein